MEKIKKHNPKNNYISKWNGDILHIFDPIYRQNYYFIPAENKQQFINICKKELKMEIPKEEDDGDKSGGFKIIEKDHKCYKCGKNIMETTKICVLWANTPKNIIHESFHAISWTLRKRGISLTDESDEAFAYLLAFLTEQILKAI